MPNTDQGFSRRDLLLHFGLPNDERDPDEPVAASRMQVAIDPPVLSNAFPMLALIATRGHLPYADLAARTFLRHHPDFRLFLLLVDGGEADRQLFPYLHVILLEDLDLDEAGWLVAKLDAPEFANALKPVFLQHLRRYGNRCVYMDCDIAEAWPCATGYDPRNRGIGVIDREGGVRWSIVDAAPGEGGFGTVIQPVALSAVAQPTAGIWVQGRLLRNAAPAIEGGHVVLGWLRLTTGGGNEPGLDWATLTAPAGVA